MDDYIKATDELPNELTPVWVRIGGRRPRKMYRVGKTFFYFNKVLDRNGNYSSIGESVLWRYCKNKVNIMKERPIFENKEPNKELVTLSDEDKKVVTKALKDLIQSASFLYEMVSNGTLTEEMRETMTSLIATYSRDPLMKMPHKRLSFDWLVTRGDSSKARIYVWENKNY